jgi:hypothetical protein
MKHKTFFNLQSKLGVILVLGLLLIGLPAAVYAATVGTAFTYQGNLTDGGSPANGQYDFQFKLFDAASGGGQVGSTLVKDNVEVTNGFFSVELDFGNQFTGQARFLEIGVRPGASTGSFTLFTGRQELTPTPYALGLRPGAVIQGSGTVLSGISTGGGGNPAGVYGESSSSGGWGVVGKATSTSGANSGVRGETASNNSNATGVFGLAASANATGAGVKGQNNGTGGYGVWGQGGANAVGVLGQSGSNIGLQGVTSATSVNTPGVKGTGPAAGVIGEATNVGYGVQGKGSIGVVGTADTTGGYGVYGQSDGSSGKGVFGAAGHNGSTVYGVYGETSSSFGISGGVYGKATSNTGGVVGVLGESNANNGIGVYGAVGAGGANTGVMGGTLSPSGTGGFFSANADTGTNFGVYGRSESNSGYGGFFVNTNGGILLAANNAGSTSDLEFKVDSAGNVYADGGYHCGISSGIFNLPLGAGASGLNEGSIVNCLRDNSPADFAEMLPVVEATSLEPGDVLVIGPDGELTRSTEAYQPTVVGIYSTRPSYLGNAQFAETDGFAPLALVGIVPVKASAENGAIQPGDMLVASTLPGYAMRASGNPPQGTVIGKALSGLDEETGIIKMLVMLQ